MIHTASQANNNNKSNNISWKDKQKRTKSLSSYDASEIFRTALLDEGNGLMV